MKQITKKISHSESTTQIACVKWFRMQYKDYAKLLFAIPNGRVRDIKTGRWLKLEGVVSGVPDLMLAVPKGKYASLFIEMKSFTGRQTDAQKEMEGWLTLYGNKYVICRSFNEFKSCIENYLQA